MADQKKADKPHVQIPPAPSPDVLAANMCRVLMPAYREWLAHGKPSRA